LPQPDWYVNAPILDIGDDFYINAFFTLSTCRNYELGPIPWVVIQEFCDRYELTNREIFSHIINSLDATWLKIQSEKVKQNGKSVQHKGKI
jgi:hypothetical protein